MAEHDQNLPAPDRGTWVWLPGPTDTSSLLPELAADLHASWRQVAIAFFGAAALMLAATLLLPVRFDSAAVVSVVEENQAAALTGLAGQLGGIAGLAGIPLSLPTGDKGVVVLATLKSRAFLVDFAERHNLLEEIFRNRFDAETGQWKSRWLFDSGPPTEDDIADKMTERFRIGKDLETGLINIVVEADSAESAQDWNRMLIKDLNEKIRRRDISESENAIDYLKKQVGMTTVTALQEVYYRLIEERLKSSVLARVSAEYAVRVVDPPSLTADPSKPKRFLLAILAGIAAAFAVIFVILIRFAVRPRSVATDPRA
jgi:uncharacterized protein involved in exopolysaccharide biosynthesis